MKNYIEFINKIQKKIRDTFGEELMDINIKVAIDKYLREIFKDNEYFYKFYDMSMDFDTKKNTVSLIPNNIETVALIYGIKKEDVTYIDRHNIETDKIKIFWNGSDVYYKLDNPLELITVSIEIEKNK